MSSIAYSSELAISDWIEAELRRMKLLFAVDPGAGVAQLFGLVSDRSNLQSELIVRFAGETFAKLLWAGLVQDDVVQQLPVPIVDIFEQCNSLTEASKVANSEWYGVAAGEVVPRTVTLTKGSSAVEVPPGMRDVAEMLRQAPSTGIAALKSICDDPDALPHDVEWAANAMGKLLRAGFGVQLHGADMTEEAFDIWYDWPA